MNFSREVKSAAEQLQKALLPVARQRLDLLGKEVSGAHDFYASRIERNELIADYDVALVARMLDWGIAPMQIYEIGGGFGTLSLLLAVAGFEVVCIECDDTRYKGFEAMLGAMSEAFPSAAQRCRGSHQSFPVDPAPGNALAIVTNLGFSVPPDVQRKIIEGLAAYELAIVDIDHFFTPAENEEERRRRLGTFEDAGCVVEPFLDLGDSGRFYLLRPREMPLAGPFGHDDRYGWTVAPPDWTRVLGDHPEDPTRSPFTLFEDGRPLGPAHQSHEKVRTLGAGSYSHWRHRLYFSTSDNSDPNVNGRRYGLCAAALGPACRTPTSDAVPATAPQGLATLAADPKTASVINRRESFSLVERLKRRGVESVVYFHTDHFEPWFGRAEDDQWRALDRFADLASRSLGGRKLSLFYTPLILCNPRAPGGGNGLSVYPDEIVFVDRRAAFIEKCRQHIAPLFTAFGHECHLHVHHEYWTRTTEVYRGDVARWANEHSSPEADERRLDLYVQLSLRAIAEELGRPLGEWGFVHGNWSLNASDDSVCQIENEIEILMRNGCFGDFSFPPGRAHCTPTLVPGPYTCLPVRGKRAYDTPAADPRPIGMGAGAFEPGRFLIWNSPITADHSSLDYYYQKNLDRFGTPESLVQSWIDNSNLIDGRLFIKTHAHSLDAQYKGWSEEALIPHAHPAVTSLFELLARTCDGAGVEFEPATVNTVTAYLREAERRADHAVTGVSEPVTGPVGGAGYA